MFTDQILYSKDASGEIFAIGSIKEIDMGNWNSDVLLDGGDSRRCSSKNI